MEIVTARGGARRWCDVAHRGATPGRLTAVAAPAATCPARRGSGVCRGGRNAAVVVEGPMVKAMTDEGGVRR